MKKYLFTLFALLTIGAAVAASADDYFPQAEGNAWTYAIEGNTGGATVENRIVETGTSNGRFYYKHTFLMGGELWVTRDTSGNVLHHTGGYSPATLFKLGATSGTTWTISLSGCQSNATAQLEYVAEPVTVPAGTFQNVLAVRYYNLPCRDAGITSQYFAPGVGLIREERMSIAGPRIYALTAATIDGEAWVAPNADPGTGPLTAGLTLDNYIYTSHYRSRGTTEGCGYYIDVIASLLVANGTNTPLGLNFNTAQRYDVVIRTASGSFVYRWSTGKSFAQTAAQVSIAPGESKAFDATFSKKLNPGNYTLEMSLTGTPAFTVKVPFQVRQAQ